MTAKAGTKQSINLDEIPQDLKDARQWCVWRLEPAKDNPDRLTKVPYRASNPRWKAKSDTPSTWGTFEQAVACWRKTPDITGIGLMFDGDLCGVDLDHCASADALEPWALEYVKRLDTYTEWSQSGTGVHCLAWGSLPDKGRKRGKVEMYDKSSPRFFVVTGRTLDGHDKIERRQAEITALHAEVFGESEPEPEPGPMRTSGAMNLSDAELLTKAVSAGNGAKFEQLWDGNVNDYPSQSEADLALCNLLAFWTGRDPAAMDRLFRQSALMRAKWDRRHSAGGDTYGQMTIAAAIKNTRETYTPGQSSNTANAPAASGNDAPDLSYFLNQTADHGGHAECVRRYTDGTVLFCDALGWMVYTGKRFETNAEKRVRGIVKTVLKKRRALARDKELEAIAKSTKLSRDNVGGAMYMLASDVYVKPEGFDNAPFLLNCSNGVVDLRTGELAAHSPSNRFTYVIPTAYNPNADTRQWENVANELTGSPLMTRYLQEASGYSITGSTQEEVMFYIFGPTRAGKGTFTETILAALGGMPLATEVDFRIFTQSRGADAQNFALAPLRPCRLVAASESKSNERLNAAKVKVMTGNNEIYCANKGKDFFSYRPQYKIWLASNWPVNADPDDDAVWSRIRVIQFPNSFLGKEDKHLKRRLTEKDNLEAVLAWAVAGAVRWYERGKDGLFTPNKVEAITKEHREQQDFVGQWLSECTERTDNTDDFIPNDRLYGSYRSWCDDNGVMPKGKRTLTMALTRKGYNAGTVKKLKDPLGGWKTHRGCEGMKFVE